MKDWAHFMYESLPAMFAITHIISSPNPLQNVEYFSRCRLTRIEAKSV